MKYPKKEILAVYAMTTFDGLAGGLFSLFTPIYFLTQGYSVKNVIVFFFFYSLSTLICFFLAAWVTNRQGLRILMLLRFPFLFAYMGLLIALPKIPMPIWPIGLVSGVQAAFFYFGIHVLFANNASFKNMEKEIGSFYFWPQIIGIFLPLVGASLITKLDFSFILLLAFGLYVLSAVPLWFIADFKSKVRFSVRQFINMWNRNRYYTIIETLKNVTEEVEGIVWPIFIYLFMRNIMSLGYIETLAGIGSAIFTLIISRYLTALLGQRMIKIGFVLMAIIWLLRYYVPGNLLFYITSIITGFVGVMISVPFSSYIYRLAKKNTADEFFVYREIPVFIGRSLVYFLAIVFWQNLQYGFLLAVAGYVLLAMSNLREVKSKMT